jgi:hypothetical protein
MPAAARPTPTTAQTIVKFRVQPQLLKPCAAVDVFYALLDGGVKELLPLDPKLSQVMVQMLVHQRRPLIRR